MAFEKGQIFIIILGAVGTFLTLYIAFFLINVYDDSMVEIEEDTQQVQIDCVQYSFEVTFLEEGMLNVYNSKISSFELNDVVVEGTATSDNIKEFSFRRFARGDEKVLDISDMTITDTLRIYPKGCPKRFVECSLLEQSC